MFKKYGHVLPIIFVMLPALIYLVYQSYGVTSRKINLKEITDPSFYYTSVEITPQIEKLAHELKTVQSVLDYVTNIPYKIHDFRARKPEDTIARNYGDCDDKSNLLASILSALGYENYIVIVPRHAFVIVNLEKKLAHKKALHIDGKPFYILESTAENSEIGYELKYTENEIRAIINPLKNERVDFTDIAYY
jgi:hypothetical protein